MFPLCNWADCMAMSGSGVSSEMSSNVKSFPDAAVLRSLIWIVAVVADPPVKSAEEARKSGKLVVLLVGGIHSGECDGKEALLASTELLSELN